MTRRTAYTSHSFDAGGMLAIWLDKRPSCDKEQRDPDGWISGVSGTEFEQRSLAGIVKAPDADIITLDGRAAETWKRLDTARRRKVAKAAREATKGLQTLIPIPPDVEQLGREAALDIENSRPARARR